MNRLPLALLLLSVTASAQLTVAVQRNEYQTSALADGGSVQMFVDPLGNDNNTCKAAFTDGGVNGPCRQFQAAMNKVPPNMRHGVVVNAAAGTYNAFYISGFTYNPSFQTTTGGLYIKGAYSTVTGLTGGTATGTATGGTAGSGSTFGTLVHTGQTWTVNELRGFFVFISAGTGINQRRVISSNTADTITIVGTWTAPTGTSVYAIQRPSVIINNAAPFPPSGLFAALANMGGIVLVGNKGFEYRSGAITIEGIEYSSTTGALVSQADNSGLAMNFVRSTGASAAAIYSNALNTTPRVAVSDSYHLGTGSSSAFGASGGASAIFTRVLAQNSFSLLQLSAGSGSAVNAFITSCETLNATAGVFAPAGNLFISGSRFNCSAGTGVGVYVGSNGQFVLNASNHFGVARAEIQTTDIGSVCGTGVIAYGPTATAILNNVTGTVATTAMMANWGGRIQTISGVTITGGSQDVSLDNGALTGTFAQVTASSCTLAAGTSTYGSRVCK
jgi:hypothetical protein